MKTLQSALLTLFIMASSGLLLHGPSMPSRPGVATSNVVGPGDFAKLRAIPVVNHAPLWFEPNEGQFPKIAKFGTHSDGHSVYLSENGLWLGSSQPADRIAQFHSSSVLHGSSTTELRFLGANRNPKITAFDKLQSVSNYFRGSDPKRWQTKVGNYSRVVYENVYPGVNLICHGQQNQPEFDWVVGPGADADHIRFSVRGANPTIDLAGDLVLRLSDSKMRMKKPVIYQEVGGVKLTVNGDYTLSLSSEVSFRIGKFDRTHPLVIDPVLVYSTFLGGSIADGASQIAVDSSENIYVIGGALSNDFPLVNPLQSNKTGFSEAFVTKFDASGSNVIYSTYLGGTAPGHVDGGSAIAVDAAGNAYITGSTNDLNFPTTPGAYLPAPGGVGICGNCSDGWVAKLDPTGSSLLFSTYLTGNGNNIQSVPTGIALDKSNEIYLTGFAYPTGFPITPGAYTTPTEGVLHIFVTKLNSTGSALVYSSLFGGNGNDQAFAIGVDSFGNAYLTGFTSSTDFPVTTTLQEQLVGFQAFVVKMNATGSQLVYSTLFGSGHAFGIAVDGSGSAYIAGYADDYLFPTAGPMQTHYQNNDAFVSKLDPSGASLIYSIFLGGSNVDQANSIAIDTFGNAYVTGRTQSPDFPTVNAVQPSYSGGTLCAYNCSDAFVTVVSADGSKLLFSTYLGDTGFEVGNGIAVDPAGSIFVTGVTSSPNFPLVKPYQTAIKVDVQNGGATSFVVKIAGNVSITPQRLVFGPAPIGVFQRQGLGIASAPQTVVFTNNSASPITFTADTFVGTNPKDFSTVNDNCAGSVVQASGTCTIAIAFTPAAVGIRSANLQLGNSTGDTPYIVSLLGYGSPLTFAPATLAFGPQDPGTTSSPQSLTITNNGQSPIGIGTLTPATGLFPIQQDACAGMTLVAGASCKVMIAFSPQSIIDYSAIVTVNDSASDSPQSVLMTGTGAGPRPIFSSDFLQFTHQSVGTTSPPQAITLTNEGTALLNITGIATPSDFSQTNDCKSQIAVGGICTIQISFTPTSNGDKVGELLVSDDGFGSPQFIVLSGNAGAGISELAASPSSLNFGNQTVGTTSSSLLVNLQIAGTAAVNISNISTSGDFAETNGCPSSLSPGMNCGISVMFVPTAAGPRTGSLSVAYNGAGSPLRVSLGGQGNDFALTASPANSTVTAGSSATYNIAVSPVGGTYNSGVSLGCSSLPRGTSCTFSQPLLTPGTSSAQSTLTISTSANGIAPQFYRFRLPPMYLDAKVIVFIAALLFVLSWERRFKKIGVMLTVVLGLCILSSCGGGGGGTTPPSTGTPPGAYPITVSGISGSLTHSQSVTLTVQ
jgi:beta-propeller repeat-containing protein/HYDIN/CFA65/VesB family protein